jgi:hypothetical protein
MATVHALIMGCVAPIKRLRSGLIFSEDDVSNDYGYAYRPALRAG